MSKATEANLFTTPLSTTVRSQAQKYRQQQISVQKAKQVYLNTLAVSAVDVYLRCLGFETDKSHSDSHNSLAIKFMDVADLKVKDLGKLECRPVLPDAQICEVPPEVSSDRIAYVAVRLDRELRQGTLLGFSPVASSAIQLSQLQPLSEFPTYLNSIKSKVLTKLENWFTGMFETGWQTVEATLSPNQYQLAVVRSPTESDTNVQRARLIDTGMQLGEQAVVLMIAIARNDDCTTNVLVQIHPSRQASLLPPNLDLVLLDESGATIREVRSRSQDNYIQLPRFKGESGDRFSIQVKLDQVSVTESFLF